MFTSSLIQAGELAARLHQPNLLILDASCHVDDNYNEHAPAIPGALRFDIEQQFCDPDASLPNMMPSAERFSALAQALGISANSHIVVYDSKGIFSSARAWWMFKSMGHAKVYLLDGGLPAWQALGLQTATLSPATHTGDFVARFAPDAFVDRHAVLAACKHADGKVVDARAAARFHGTAPEPREGMRAYHIPGSVSLPFESLLADGQFKPTKTLFEAFQARGLQPTDRIIFSCGSGVTACVDLFAAHLCGYPNLSVYDGSWSEWGSDPSLPIVSSADY
ncbi:sulfurtransferase [Pseudobowmanella zhangzhouensis]|uniref:sulfurtransferase n=1 Tax=Pseudobowmanella zhangzhouensis TaxID=1537679 RepID=UPI003609471A